MLVNNACQQHVVDPGTALHCACGGSFPYTHKLLQLALCNEGTRRDTDTCERCTRVSSGSETVDLYHFVVIYFLAFSGIAVVNVDSKVAGAGASSPSVGPSVPISPFRFPFLVRGARVHTPITSGHHVDLSQNLTCFHPLLLSFETSPRTHQYHPPLASCCFTRFLLWQRHKFCLKTVPVEGSLDNSRQNLIRCMPLPFLCAMLGHGRHCNGIHIIPSPL